MWVIYLTLYLCLMPKILTLERSENYLKRSCWEKKTLRRTQYSIEKYRYRNLDLTHSLALAFEFSYSPHICVWIETSWCKRRAKEYGKQNSNKIKSSNTQEESTHIEYNKNVKKNVMCVGECWDIARDGVHLYVGAWKSGLKSGVGSKRVWCVIWWIAFDFISLGEAKATMEMVISLLFIVFARQNLSIVFQANCEI